MRNHLPDLTPFRYRDYRLLWIGLFISRVGSGITMVATASHINELTAENIFKVGLLGVAQLVPVLFSALIGGAFADAFDRRRLARVTDLALMGCSLGLAANALGSSPRLWPIYGFAALAAAFEGFQRPALEAIGPRLVPHDVLPAAAALNSIRGTLAFFVGPLAGGVLIATLGYSMAFFVDALTYVVSLAFLMLLRPISVSADAERPSLKAIGEGLRYARSRTELMGTYIIDIVALFFGIPLAALPKFANQLGGVSTYGLLLTAPGFGAFLASLSGRWTAKVHRHGRAIVLAAVLWGVGIIGLGLSQSVWMAFMWFAIAGGADMVSGIFRMRIWNETIPDSIRGRMAGIEMIGYTTGPLLGQVESGVASLFLGVRGVIVSGGVMCVGGSGAVAAALPEFWRYDDRTSPAALAEREARLKTQPATPAIG